MLASDAGRSEATLHCHSGCSLALFCNSIVGSSYAYVDRFGCTPDTVKELRHAFPHLEIALEELEPIEGIAALRSWRTDIALIDDLSILAGDNRESVGVVPLAEDVLYVAVATDHPLSKKPSLGVADRRHETWAMESTWSTFGRFVTDLCRRAGYERSRQSYSYRSMTNL